MTCTLYMEHKLKKVIYILPNWDEPKDNFGTFLVLCFFFVLFLIKLPAGAQPRKMKVSDAKCHK